MISTILFVVVGALVACLFLIFPRPPIKPQRDPKYYTLQQKVTLPVRILNQIDRALEDLLGIRIFKVDFEYVEPQVLPIHIRSCNDGERSFPGIRNLAQLVESVPKSCEEIFGPQDEVLTGLKKLKKSLDQSKLSAFGIFLLNTQLREPLVQRFLFLSIYIFESFLGLTSHLFPLFLGRRLWNMS